MTVYESVHVHGGVERPSARKVLTIVGTRPEVIKMAPVYLALKAAGDEFDVELCAVGQQQRVLIDALDEWRLAPDRFVSVDSEDRRIASVLSRIVTALQDEVERAAPDIVLVQGDTTTCLAGALAAFYRRVQLGHVEAGLRSGSFDHPFPEEMHRHLADRLASVHYAATTGARDNLLAEGYSGDTIRVVGNTVVDALFYMRRNHAAPEPRVWPHTYDILVTSHRRESFGAGMRDIASAIRTLVERRNDVSFTYVLHPHPAAREAAFSLLGRLDRVELVEPQGYRRFAELMHRSHIVITDSGGVQEEAPYLGKPVLVTRQVTERPEAVEAGVARIVGTDTDRIIAAVDELMDDPAVYARMSRTTAPFGDGQAASRIVADLRQRIPVAAVQAA